VCGLETSHPLWSAAARSSCNRLCCETEQELAPNWIKLLPGRAQLIPRTGPRSIILSTSPLAAAASGCSRPAAKPSHSSAVHVCAQIPNGNFHLDSVNRWSRNGYVVISFGLRAAPRRGDFWSGFINANELTGCSLAPLGTLDETERAYMSRDPSKLRVNIALMRWQTANRYASFVNSPDKIQTGNFLLNRDTHSICISYTVYGIWCVLRAAIVQNPRQFKAEKNCFKIIV
jgi:hypothetical protein